MGDLNKIHVLNIMDVLNITDVLNTSCALYMIHVLNKQCHDKYTINPK